MSDMFGTMKSGLESPATHLMAVTPDDTADLPVASRGLNVGTSGAVRVTTVGGTTETVYVAAGSAFPLRVTRVWQTGTNAANIVAMY
jgi:hypothetical protein